MNDCAENGDYCKFHKRFLELLSKLESQEWFSKFEIPEQFEFTFNEFGEIQKEPKIAQFYEVEFMKEIISKKVGKLERRRNKFKEFPQNGPSLIMEHLENYNFEEKYSYLLEPEEEIVLEEEGPLRRKRKTNYIRSRRNIGEEEEGVEGSPPQGDGEEENKSVSYIAILNNVKRFLTVADKIVKSGLSTRPDSLGNKEDCWVFEILMEMLAFKSGIKDGSQYSFAKIKHSEMLKEMVGEFEEVADSNFASCNAEKTAKIIEANLQELKKFIEYKEFDDGFSQRIR